MSSDFPILILTLRGEGERRAPLLRALDRAGLDYTLIYGVDGRQGLPAEYVDQIDRVEAERRNRRPLSDGEFACSLSHRRAYQYILDNNLAGAVILEDDAIPCGQFATFMAERIYRRAPIVLLDYSRISVSRKRPLFVSGAGELLRVVKSSTLATGYTVAASAARDLVTRTTPVRDVADWPCNLAKLGAAVIWPQLIDHPEPGALSHLTVDRLPLEAQRKCKEKGRHLRFDYWVERWLTIRSRRINPDRSGN